MGFVLRIPITKIDDEQKRVFGFAMTAADAKGQLVEDHQRDVVTPADLEEAVYDYVRCSREAGVMHERGGAGDLIASVVLTPDVRKAMGVPIGATSWFLGFQITDDSVWKRVKSGELREFSIEGEAVRETVR